MSENTENAEEKGQAEDAAGEAADTEAQAGDNPTSIVENLRNQVKELTNFKEKYFYLAAEHENYRKRMEREKETIVKYANEKVLGSLIEIVDNFERVIAAIKDDSDQKVKNIHIGMDMVLKQFFNNLKDCGLEPVDSLGKQFDPNVHEAIGQKNVEGKEDDFILEELQKGYVLNGRLLRAAKVVIVKN